MQKRRYRLPLGLVAMLMAVWIFGSCTAAGATIVEDLPTAEKPWTSHRLKNDPEAFQFVIVGDRTGSRRPGVFPEALTKLNQLEPEFTISVGDLIEGYTDDEKQIDREWDELLGFVNKRLSMPFFFVPGNHDVYSDVSRKKWIERFGSLYYHFKYKDVLFLVLYSGGRTESEISADQIQYAKEVLEENQDVRWTCVFFHKPLWAYQEASGKNNGWDKVEALLGDRPFSVFAGHAHGYTKYVRNGRTYLVLATTGGRSNLSGPASSAFDHVAWVTMTDQGPKVANIMLDGLWDENICTEEWSKKYIQLYVGTSLASKIGSIRCEGDEFERGTTTLHLENKTEYPMHATGHFEPHATVQATPWAVNELIPPGGSKDIQIEIKAINGKVPVRQLDTLNMETVLAMEIPNDKRPVEFHPEFQVRFDSTFHADLRTESVTVDGKLNEWGELPFIVRRPAVIRHPRGWQTWHGAHDSWYRFAVERNEEYLYVAAESFDDKHMDRYKTNPYVLQDAILLLLDPRGDADRPSRAARKDILYLELLPNPKHMAALPKGVKAACIRTTKGMAAEVAIPLSYLNDQQKGRWESFGFNLGLEDWDGGNDLSSAGYWHKGGGHRGEPAGIFRRR